MREGKEDRYGDDMFVSLSITILRRGTFMFCFVFHKVVTPWVVEAADEIDYSKLVHSFGYVVATLNNHNYSNI